MRHLITVLCLVFATLTHASSNYSEITDTWIVPSEGGWGVTITMQNNVAFMSFFIYDANRNPTWFIAVLNYAPGYVFAGNVYADKGPYFGGPFDPNTVTERLAGTASFTVNNLNQATLIYTIDGITATKQMERLTFANEDFTGSYFGGYSLTRIACTPSSLNGRVDVPAYLSVTHTGAGVQIVATSIDVRYGTCTFTGTYAQTGKLGASNGTFSCTSGSIGSFNIFEMTPTLSGFTARYTDQNPIGQVPGCQQATGFIGGIRTVQ